MALEMPFNLLRIFSEHKIITYFLFCHIYASAAHSAFECRMLLLQLCFYNFFFHQDLIDTSSNLMQIKYKMLDWWGFSVMNEFKVNGPMY